MASGTLIAVLATVLLTVVTVFVAKRLYFDPLARYPGPKLWALTRLPYSISFAGGTLAHKLRDFHMQYGEVIRVAPDELSYIRPDASREIYLKRPNSKYKTLPKDPFRQPAPKPPEPAHISASGDADHARIRKAWAPAFSSQSLAAQEPLVRGYVTAMVNKLTEMTKLDGKPVDLHKWYSFVTFDIITSLCFGEDLGCIERGAYHEWISQLVFSVKAMVQMAACRFYPPIYSLLVKLTSAKAREVLAKHHTFTKERVQHRLQNPSSHPDFFTHLQKSREGMSDAEIEVNAVTMIFAGSHTTQSLLTGLTLKLVKFPDVLKRATAEVREAFSSEAEISYKKLSMLPYLNAIASEGMRIVAPVPTGVTRMIPEGGAVICGDFIPEKTILSFNQWAAYTLPTNFAEPEKFIPERWLDPGQVKGQTLSKLDFPQDRLEAVQGFSLGTRDCIGQNLAKMEILLILACMMYRFDMSAAPQGVPEWEAQETYVVWMGSPLPIQLKVASPS